MKLQQRVKIISPRFNVLFVLLVGALTTYPFSAEALPRILASANYWECILDEMEGVKNDLTAKEARRLCQTAFPSTAVPPRSIKIFGTNSFLGPKTMSECMVTYGKDVTSRRAEKEIRYACYNLYSIK